MVQHCDLKEFPCLDKKPGYLDIILAGLWNARRVRVTDDNGSAIELKGQTKQFADSDYDVTLYFATSSANVAEMLPPGAGSQVGHALSRPRRARLPHTQHHLRGLDSAWPVKSNPHRESGTRFGLRQTLDRQEGRFSRQAERTFGDRLGDSVGAGSSRLVNVPVKYSSACHV